MRAECMNSNCVITSDTFRNGKGFRNCMKWCAVAVFLLISSKAYGVNSWGCFGLGAAEYFVPGLGYAITRQWDKAIILGGARWMSAIKYGEAVESDYYQEDVDDIYDTINADDSGSGKTETTVTLTKETWQANYYGSLYTNLLFTTWGDLYQNRCEPNTETYSLMLSPFRFDHFYKKWQFWLPVAIALGSYSTFDDSSTVDYYLSRGLTESSIKRDSFSQYYMVGVGEEMFFRGTLQNYLFETFSKDWGISPGFSRHLSVLTGSAIFAAAHTGSGFTANPAVAFVFGVYEGYVYHPSLEEFDLMTAIAIHSWWDLLITYSILNHAEFTESQAQVEVPLFKIGFRF